MQEEVEAKFLKTDHAVERAKLRELGADLEQPMRLMRRTLFDYPDNRLAKAHSRLRVRDEGDKVTVTYKSRSSGSRYDQETETTLGSYDTMVELLKAIGLVVYTFQESKRETWHCQGAEVVLDEWPWLSPYIEIEGPDEETIKACAEALGHKWEDAKFGDVMWRIELIIPGMKESEGVGVIPNCGLVVSFRLAGGATYGGVQSMIKVVLFDYGGVLTEAGRKGSISETIAELYGIDIGWEKLDDLHNKTSPRPYFYRRFLCRAGPAAPVCQALFGKRMERVRHGVFQRAEPSTNWQPGCVRPASVPPFSPTSTNDGQRPACPRQLRRFRSGYPVV